jgi:hypothetical protein
MGKFIIPKNSHRSIGFLWPFAWKNKFLWRVKFSPECLAKGEGKDSEDLNKLIGVSDGWDHRKNSIRIAWRSEKDYISLWNYIYEGGKLNYRFICVVPVDRWVKIDLEISKYEYFIGIDGTLRHERTIERRSRWWGPRYLLRPFFGGNLKSPETMGIEIK